MELIRRADGPAATDAPSPTADAPRERLAWPDVAKGLCILLVVLHHVTTKLYPTLVPADLGAISAAWVGVTTFLKPIRMPLFFAISGWFAARAIDRPWSQVRRRVSGPYYLYVVWVLVFCVVYSFETTLPANRTEGVGDFLGEMVFAATSLWFLYALAVYFVLAKALRGLPVPLVLGAAALLAASTSWLPLDETNRVSVLMHFGYFAFGAYCPALVGRIAERARVLPLAAAYGVVAGVLGLVGAPRSVALVLVSLVGVPLGVAVGVRLSRSEVLAPLLGWLGRRTLGIYVLHLAVLSVVAHLPVGLGSGPVAVLAAAVFPVVLSAAIVGACLLLRSGLERAGAPWLFELPRRLPAWVPSWLPSWPVGRSGVRDRAAVAGPRGERAEPGQVVPVRVAAHVRQVGDVGRRAA